MPRHRRPRPGPFVRREDYLELWARYSALLADYRALTQDHQDVLEDHEQLLYDQPPEPPVRGQDVVPSWAQTEPIPLITSAGAPGLDPDKAEALVRRMSLLDDPAGAWGVTGQETG